MAQKLRIPNKTRRLTRSEADALGFSFTAKRRVSASIPKGKAKLGDRTFTDRQVATVSIQRREGRRKATRTRESFAKSRTVKSARSGRTHFRSLTKPQLFKLLRANPGRDVNLYFQVKTDQAAYSPDREGYGWRAASTKIETGALIANFDDFVRRQSKSKEPPRRYAVIM